uniref:RNA polymerase-associated protein LEO1 n=1 Tax=Caenorhabditis japonica TaxID=281687 RepID=A0A8R1EVA1_CAEJA
VENTLRWRIRKDESGREVRESNAKIVKWDDGTMSLYLGNEIFEVTLMELNKNNLPHLYVQQPGLMSAQSVMTHRMTFRPHSTDSQTHRKVTLNMADRSRKSGQVKVMDDVGQNPEITRR